MAWTLGLGPVPQLQLAPLMFVPHVLLDAYAFDRAEMFDTHPTTSRAAERTAVDDIDDVGQRLQCGIRAVDLTAAVGRHHQSVDACLECALGVFRVDDPLEDDREIGVLAQEGEIRPGERGILPEVAALVDELLGSDATFVGLALNDWIDQKRRLRGGLAERVAVFEVPSAPLVDLRVERHHHGVVTG